MKRRRLKKSVYIFGILFLLFIIGIIYLVKTINYHKTYEYKFKTIGYSMSEIKNIEKLDNKTKDYILELDYNKNLNKLIKNKYFIEKNIKEYINYMKEEKDIVTVVAKVNTNANKEWYSNSKKTDTSKGILMLTNKFNYLDNTYTPKDLVNISNRYSYGSNQKMIKEAFDAFVQMFNDAKKEGLTLIINSSYRSYEEQEKTYHYYEKLKGEVYADSIAARAGHSEHQTGLAIDIQTYKSNAKNFEEFEEFKWLIKNAHKYGFILRYPKEFEEITGYAYESWHFRYVGLEASKYIYENNITFDEYYAYFLQ